MDDCAALEALSSLAQVSRLDAFKLLVRHTPDGLAAGDVARMLAVPQNTMSSHLGKLQRAGLIQANRHGKHIIYHADLDQLRALMLFLVRDCCGASAELTEPLMSELTLCRGKPQHP